MFYEDKCSNYVYRLIAKLYREGVCTSIVVKTAFKPSSTLRHPIDMSRVKKRVTEEKKRVEIYQDLESTDRLYNKVMVRKHCHIQVRCVTT